MNPQLATRQLVPQQRPFYNQTYSLNQQIQNRTSFPQQYGFYPGNMANVPQPQNLTQRNIRNITPATNFYNPLQGNPQPHVQGQPPQQQKVPVSYPNSSPGLSSQQQLLIQQLFANSTPPQKSRMNYGQPQSQQAAAQSPRFPPTYGTSYPSLPQQQVLRGQHLVTPTTYQQAAKQSPVQVQKPTEVQKPQQREAVNPGNQPADASQGQVQPKAKQAPTNTTHVQQPQHIQYYPAPSNQIRQSIDPQQFVSPTKLPRYQSPNPRQQMLSPQQYPQHYPQSFLSPQYNQRYVSPQRQFISPRQSYQQPSSYRYAGQPQPRTLISQQQIEQQFNQQASQSLLEPRQIYLSPGQKAPSSRYQTAETAVVVSPPQKESKPKQEPQHGPEVKLQPDLPVSQQQPVESKEAVGQPKSSSANDADSEKSGLQHTTLHLANGDEYYGDVLNGVKEGFGILKNNLQLEIYKGDWKNDTYDGFGILNNVNYKEGQENTDVDYSDLTNIKDKWISYEGEFKSGQFNGRGTYYFANGDKFNGTFVNSVIQGDGTYERKDLDTVTGKWDHSVLLELI